LAGCTTAGLFRALVFAGATPRGADDGPRPPAIGAVFPMAAPRVDFGFMEAFGEIARAEIKQLIPVFQNTLTFTVTFQAVSSLVDQEESAIPVLLAATSTLTFVLLALIEPARQLGGAPGQLVSYLLGLATQLSTQFVSNLIAISLRSVFVDAASTWWIIAFAVLSVALLWTATARLE